MKKLFIAFTIAAACYACGGGESSGDTKPISNNEENKNSQIGVDTTSTTTTTPAPSSTTTTATTTAPAEGKDGKALIEASDCRTCHKDDTKLIGPAYTEVAVKYEATDANIKLLADKILKGGQGVWGEIPMAGHPAMSQEDAEAMVKYILSMKK